MSSQLKQVKNSSPGPVVNRPGQGTAAAWRKLVAFLGERAQKMADGVFIWPAVIFVLTFSIFPLIISLYLSFSRFRFVQGGFEVSFVGFNNYQKLLFGADKVHFLGLFGEEISPFGWLILAATAGALGYGLYRYARSRQRRIGGLIGRFVTAFILLVLTWILVQTLLPGGRPGTLVVTLVYVFIGVTVQYSLGLALALLAVQKLPGRRFFRVVFLIPMMITPVGVAYMFRMLTDTGKGPLKPLWDGLGLTNFSWTTDAWSARTAIMIGDTWQWTPFMFIILLAALEGISLEPIEAAIVDGANRWQLFRYITWPSILPVTSTLVLIRMIESFKIIDLPNVLTNGGPGTATESLSLNAYFAWRTLDLGGSAAIAYMLLFVVTFLGVTYVNLIRNRALEAI